MRRIDTLIIHCSATKAGMDFGAADIDRWHRERGMNGIGYHYVVRLDGQVEKGREIALPGAHCIGWNSRSIGICYIGGLDAEGHPADTRTEKQKKALKELIEQLKEEYAIDLVIGHRDTSPDLNGNGVIEPNEFVKVCPCFDVRAWLLTFLITLVLVACGSTRGKVIEKMRYDSTAAVNQSSREEATLRTKQQAYEQIDEHIEQLTFTFKGESNNTDSLRERKNGQMRSLASVTQTKINRRKGSTLYLRSDSLVNRSDSLRTLSRLVVQKKQQQEKTGRWRWGIIVIGGGLLLLGAWIGWRVAGDKNA